MSIADNQTFLCHSKNDVVVTYDPLHSHAATHLQDTPQLKDLVIEVISRMTLEGEEIATHVDMGRIVGTCDVVEVDDTDEIVYGVRKNRDDDGWVPFTRTRLAKPSSNVAVVLHKQPDGSYELASAWVGTFDDDDEPFPGSPDATANSIEYWDRLAFVWGSQEIKEGTLRSDCPW